MPYRPGAGRPRGSRKGEALTPKAIRRDARKLGLTPLDFLLKVMRDPAESPYRRDRAAICAAPFVHPKATRDGG